jgi:hypothetical protein
MITERMSWRRLVLVHALIVGLCGASLYDLRTDQEHWPFSPYAMFAAVDRSPVLESYRVVGVERGTGALTHLVKGSEIAPFDQCRLATAFARVYTNPARKALTPVLLSDVLSRYESHRVAGDHSGPPLQAARLYKMTWTVRPDGSNIDAPDSARLLVEVPLHSSTIGP